MDSFLALLFSIPYCLIFASILVHCAARGNNPKQKDQAAFEFRTGSTSGVDKKTTDSTVSTEAANSGRGEVKAAPVEGPPPIAKSASKASVRAGPFTPAKQPLNDKEKAIASGAMRKRTEYPTFDDAPSDWEDLKKQTPVPPSDVPLFTPTAEAT